MHVVGSHECFLLVVQEEGLMWHSHVCRCYRMQLASAPWSRCRQPAPRGPLLLRSSDHLSDQEHIMWLDLVPGGGMHVRSKHSFQMFQA
jgi:hypothetical protein